jgi:hypothetical protein
VRLAPGGAPDFRVMDVCGAHVCKMGDDGGDERGE